jgi:hypothetical protein
MRLLVMKFTQTGTFQSNALDKHLPIKPMESVHEILLDRLDYFIGFVDKERPDGISDYVRKLMERYQGLVEGDYLGKPSGEITEIFTRYENLNPYPDLNIAALNYFFHLLGLDDKRAWEKAEVDISMGALVQAWIYPSYYILEALAETIGRGGAVKLYKRYITGYYIEHPAPDRDEFVSLEKRLEERLSGDTTSSEWVIVHTMLADGKYAFKNKNCPTCADATIDLPDVQFKYLVCCYGDYEKFRANTSEHIILTMEHTIMQGDAYCSRVLHDTRIDYDLRHPPKEFWDNFEPGKEEAAKKYYNK